MALPRVQLPSLRAFLGALGLTKTATATPGLGLYSLQGAATGGAPLTDSDTAVRDVVNAVVASAEALKGQATIINLGVLRSTDYVMSVAEASAPVIELYGSTYVAPEGLPPSLVWPTGLALPDGTRQIVRDRSTSNAGASLSASGIFDFRCGATSILSPLKAAESVIVWTGGVPALVDARAMSSSYAEVIVNDVDVTVSVPTWACSTIRCTGALTANRKIIMPLIAGRSWVLMNDTTGGFHITMIGASGTGTTTTSPVIVAVCDGTNFYQ